MAAAKRNVPRERDSRISVPAPVDSFDEVPAAVLCARCGQADCSGSCDEVLASGVFVLIPWERLDGPWQKRLFATARATTVEPEAFFERLPDGPVVPALFFALAAEMLAALALMTTVLVPVALLFHETAAAVLFDSEARRSLGTLVVAGAPVLALVLVLAHAVHGLSIDLGARREGAKGSRTRALRFGLYATGWDLVVGPLGLVVLAVSEGPRAALRIGSSVGRLPSRATRAFLRSAYKLDEAETARALRVSYAGAALATLVSAALVVAAVLLAWVR